jgi:hypothetical protein
MNTVINPNIYTNAEFANIEPEIIKLYTNIFTNNCKLTNNNNLLLEKSINKTKEETEFKIKTAGTKELHEMFKNPEIIDQLGGGN